jgi:hypothetical protein
MTRRLVGSLRGVGTVHAGDILLRTTAYDLSFWAEDEPRVPAENSQSVATVDGHIDITGIQEAVVLAGPGTLTLTIEDGRRIAFELTSSAGAISGRGWLP